MIKKSYAVAVLVFIDMGLWETSYELYGVGKAYVCMFLRPIALVLLIKHLGKCLYFNEGQQLTRMTFEVGTD